jgi:hypothetical protein
MAGPPAIPSAPLSAVALVSRTLVDVLDIFGDFQELLFVVLTLGSLALMVYALIDAVRVRTDAFPLAGKQTKNIWLLILGVAVAINLVAFNALSIFNLLGVVAAAVYVVDVRPAVRQVGGGRRGGSTHEGPYGPW